MKAHSMFGSRGPLLAPEDTTGGGGAPAESEAPGEEAGSVTMTLKEFNSQMAAARRSGQGKAPRAAERGLSPIDQLTATVSELAKIVATREAPTTAAPTQATTGLPIATAATPASAPQAPSGAVNPASSGGLTDLWNLSREQLSQMGPSGVRRAFDAILDQHRVMSGAARLPTVPFPMVRISEERKGR